MWRGRSEQQEYRTSTLLVLDAFMYIYIIIYIYIYSGSATPRLLAVMYCRRETKVFVYIAIAPPHRGTQHRHWGMAVATWVLEGQLGLLHPLDEEYIVFLLIQIYPRWWRNWNFPLQIHFKAVNWSANTSEQNIPTNTVDGVDGADAGKVLCYNEVADRSVTSVIVVSRHRICLLDTLNLNMKE